ncbi:hypothetical protein [uncultured Sphingomonas sp.]|jgi:hypothetical protein|uniref:hypothetical protein n=1 Tax=unclassified Sphingomonas TaxID=196159 RepID=UPI0025F1BA19|nr:hypothetical protein [uncultured Sphingomonas sp.]
MAGTAAAPNRFGSRCIAGVEADAADVRPVATGLIMKVLVRRLSSLIGANYRWMASISFRSA